MSDAPVTAIAHPNIAFIKYWGNQDESLRLPSSGSISMNLATLYARTSIILDPGLKSDTLVLNGHPASGQALTRVQVFLDLVRSQAESPLHANVVSENNFPTSAGIASSAAAFAALCLAACQAMGLQLSERDLSRLARRGSGSACRSIPAGFVEWQAGTSDWDSFAVSIAQPDHWDLTDCIALVSSQPKPVGSSEGHGLAGTSPLQSGRLAGVVERLKTCRNAILNRDFAALANVAEVDSHLMHAVMMTSAQRLIYWAPASLVVMQAVSMWRKGGVPAFYTLDAGPNVHVICLSSSAPQVESLLSTLPGVAKVLVSTPGEGAHLVSSSSTTR